MTEIYGSKDCGNSPKNRFVQDLAVALESGKTNPDDFSEGVVWEGALPSAIHGRNALLGEVSERREPASITVDHAISHGKVGAASGVVELTNGQKHRFCHVFEFTTAKANCVGAIKSYGGHAPVRR